MSRRKQFVLAGFLVASLGFMSNAGAVDDKYYPGITCHPDPGTLGIPTFFDGSLANNSTTDALAVHCPFVRDSTEISSGRLEAFDRNSTSDVSCTIVYDDWQTGTTNYAASSVSVNTTGSSWGKQSVNFGGVLAPTYGGSYYAACNIPPIGMGASHIVLFAIVESP